MLSRIFMGVFKGTLFIVALAIKVTGNSLLIISEELLKVVKK